jgi:hypothetical protein
MVSWHFYLIFTNRMSIPEMCPGEKGWGPKISAVWMWKNQLRAHYPQEVFYGKMKGGAQVLMTLDYLRSKHYPQLAQVQQPAWFRHQRLNLQNPCLQ